MSRGFRSFASLMGRLGVVALALAAPGCKQGAGDRCEIDSDCRDGLMCLNVVSHNGTCGTTATAATTGGTGGTSATGGTGGADGDRDAAAGGTDAGSDVGAPSDVASDLAPGADAASSD